MKISRSGRSIQRPLKYIESQGYSKEEAGARERQPDSGSAAMDLSADTRVKSFTVVLKADEENSESVIDRKLPQSESGTAAPQNSVVQNIRLERIGKLQKNSTNSLITCSKLQSKRTSPESAVQQQSNKKQKPDGEGAAKLSKNKESETANLLQRRPSQSSLDANVRLCQTESRDNYIELDRGIEQSIDRQNLEHNMVNQNLIIQENQRLTVEEQLALLHAGHQIQTDNENSVLEQTETHPKSDVDIDLEDPLLKSQEVMLMNETDIEITLQTSESSESLHKASPALDEVVSPMEEETPVSKAFPTWYEKLSGMLLDFLHVEQMVDVVFQGEDGDTVPAHQLILGHVSPLLADILRDVKRDCPEETLTIILPSIKTFSIRELVQSLYTGRLPIDKDTRLEMWNLAALLGLPLELPAEKMDAGAGDTEVPENTQSQETVFIAERDDDENSEDVVKVEEVYLEEEQMDMIGDSLQDVDPSSVPVSNSQNFNSSSQSKNTDADLDPLVQKEEKPAKDVKEPEILIMENQNVQVVQTETGDILILTCENSNVNESTGTQDVSTENKYFENENSVLQNKICELCNQSAQNHRIEAEDRNLYICCRMKCTNSIIKSVRAFHEHVQSHRTFDEKRMDEEPEIRYEPADKPCPLCFKPRIEHKNRDIAEPEKGNHKGNLYKCCLCFASRLTAKKFFTHLENHVAKKHVCNICKKGYSYKHLLEEHVWKMHGEGQFLWLSCPYENCDYKARYKQTLHTHVNEHHKGVVRKQGDTNKKVTCPNCKKVLMKWYYKLHHSKTCSQKSLLYKCEVCGKEGFINQTTLQNHVRLKHSEERPYACEYCPSKYATAMSLSSHRSRKHGVNSRGEEVPRRVFPCSICNKLLTSSIKLKSHIEVIHEGRRDFNCKFCGKSFTSKSNLQIHEGSQHTGILPYNCDHCDKSFGRKQQLRNHMESSHQDMVPTSYICVKQEPGSDGASRTIMDHPGAPGAEDTSRTTVDYQGAPGTNRTAVDFQGTAGAEDANRTAVDYQGTRVITEEQLDDGHFYVVNEMEAMHGVQVGDVIIPMELVDHEASMEINVPVDDQTDINH